MNHKNIMVVDDNPDSQYILGMALKESGYRVVHVMNGYDALDKLNEEDIDLIVSDILMPGMDGFQLCWKVKSNEMTRNIPFVFYSAYYTGKSDKNFAMKIGAQEFVCKPTDPDKFVEKIKEVINVYKDSDLPPPECNYDDQDTFLREYVERLKGSIERNVLGMEESEPRLQAQEVSKPEIRHEKVHNKVKKAKPIPRFENGSYEDVIINALSLSSNGYTTNQLAKTTGISRTTIIKYLSVLKERGITDYVAVGPSKLWFSKITETIDNHNNSNSSSTVKSIARI